MTYKRFPSSTARAANSISRQMIFGNRDFEFMGDMREYFLIESHNISARRTHDAPADVARELALAGGCNRFGEPNYRAVWGWSRLDWIGGKWEDRDQTGACARSGRVAARAEIYAAQSLAYRAVAASGKLRFAGAVARGND